MNVNLMIPSRSLGRAVNQNIPVNQIHHVLSTPLVTLYITAEISQTVFYIPLIISCFQKMHFLKEEPLVTLHCYSIGEICQHRQLEIVCLPYFY